jgi:hypothetical protein
MDITGYLWLFRSKRPQNRQAYTDFIQVDESDWQSNRTPKYTSAPLQKVHRQSTLQAHTPNVTTQ